MSTKKTSPKKPATKAKVTKAAVAKTKTAKTKRTKKPCCAKPNKFFGGLIIAIVGIAATVALALIVVFTIIGMDSKLSYQNNAERFAAEYSTVDTDNPFIYRTAAEAADIIEHGTGVVYLGFASCPWCQAYAGYLNDAAKDAGLDTIYYVDIKSDRDNNTEDYQKLVSLLSTNLQYNDEGQRYIYVPEVVFVVDGRIVANDLETSKDTDGQSEPANYWTDARVEALKSRLTSYMQAVIDAAGCTDSCNK